MRHQKILRKQWIVSNRKYENLNARRLQIVCVISRMRLQLQGIQVQSQVKL
jgi:hypothetical protein